MRTGETWLVLGKGRYLTDLVVRRVTKRAPSLKAGEISFKLNLRVPRSLFETPSLEANLTVPENAAVRTADVELVPAEVEPVRAHVEAELLEPAVTEEEVSDGA